MDEELDELGRLGEELDQVLAQRDLLAVGALADGAHRQRREQHQRRVPHAPVVELEELDRDLEHHPDVRLDVVPQLRLQEQLPQDVQRVDPHLDHLALRELHELLDHLREHLPPLLVRARLQQAADRARQPRRPPEHVPKVVVLKRLYHDLQQLIIPHNHAHTLNTMSGS